MKKLMNKPIYKIIKGRELKELYPDEKFIKVTKETMIHNGMTYGLGENKDIRPLNIESNAGGGLYFATFSNLVHFMSYGNGYHEIDFSDDEDIFITETEFKARTIILKEKILFDSILDESWWINLIRINSYAIWYSPTEIKNSENVALVAVAKNIHVLRYFSDAIQNNEKVILAAVTQEPYAIEYIPDKFKNNEKMALAAVSQNGKALQYLSDELKNNETVALAAIKQSRNALKYVSEELKNSEKIEMALLDQYGW